MSEAERVTRMDGTHCRIGLDLCDWLSSSIDRTLPRCLRFDCALKSDTRGALYCEACRGVEQRDGRTD